MRRMVAVVALIAAATIPASARGAAGTLYVSSFNEGQVAQFAIGSSGLLSPLAPAGLAAGGPKDVDGIAISPDGTSLYASIRSGSVAQFAIGPAGALAPMMPATVPLPGGQAGRPAISPEGNSLYVPYGGGVAQFDIGGGGLLAPKSPASIATTAPLAMAVSPDGGSAYVASGTAIAEFDVGAGGRLVPKPTPSVAGGGVWISMPPDGRSLYTGANSILSGIRQYDVSPTGVLSAKTPATVGADRDLQLAISPDGRSLYAAVANLDGIAQYDIGADGALGAKHEVAGGTSPAGVAVSPDGAGVYLGNFGGGEGGGTTISQYAAGPGGLLAPKSPAAAGAPIGPWWMFARPDQGPIAAFTVRRAAAGSPVFFDGSASSDPDGTVKRYDWDFGDGFRAGDAGPTVNHTFARGTHRVTLTAVDDEGCSNRIVFTGQTALCNGGGAASRTTSIVVPAVFRGVILKKQTVKVKGRLSRVKVGCPKGVEGPCRGKLVLAGVGKAKLSVGAGKTRHVRVKVSSAKLAFLERAGKLVAKATATAHDGFGVKRTTKAKVTLKAP